MNMTFAELSDLAALCAHNARSTADKRVAEELWKMALEYQEKAAKLDSGKKPDIGESPDFLDIKKGPPSLAASSSL
jgi:hypothetical protein